MGNPHFPPNPASLCEHYEECMRAFRRLLRALNEEGCRVIHLKQVHLPELVEEYARAKIWGSQSKAELPAGARGSLDDTLRNDKDLKAVVLGVFMRLAMVLDRATSIAERKFDPSLGEDYDSISSLSADSDSDSDGSTDSDRKYQRRSVPKICILVQQISGQIRSLFRLSTYLRQPKVTDKYIRSVNSKPDTSLSNDSGTLSLSVGFRMADENHVIEKVLQWRGMNKTTSGVDFEEEEVAPTEEGPTIHGVEDIVWFYQRLARGNTRRREQLQYWSAHPYDPKEDAPGAMESLPQTSIQAPVQHIDDVQEVRSQTSTVTPPEPSLPRPGPKSAVSKQSFSTAAVSLVHDTKTNVRPKTVYAPTAIGKGRSSSVPDPPKAKDWSSTFPCPYCGMTLECSEMENRQTWQRHVFRDLRPYVCTFEDCQNAGKLYVSRHDWIYHELQVHRREYICTECGKRSPTKKEASTHLREHHSESISLVRLNILLDLSERQVDIMGREKEPCLLCGEELSIMALQTHLAGHMEDIALFVLSNTDEDEETGGSQASVLAQKIVPRGARDPELDTGSLGFSEAGDSGQNPQDFARMLEDEEVGYADKFLSWEMKEEEQVSMSIIGTDGSEKVVLERPFEQPVPEESPLQAHAATPGSSAHKVGGDGRPVPALNLSLQSNLWFSHSTIDHKDFVPLDTLTRMINEPNIKATLDTTGGYSARFTWFRKPPDLPKRIARQAKKIFAALVLMDKVAAIHGLLEEGLEDKHLPLSLHREHEGLLSAHDGRIFPFVGWKPMSVTDFLVHKQWLFLAPVLNTADQFIKVDKEAPLPFIDSGVKGHGAAGIVHWAKIDKSHQLGFETETVDLVVAVKEFHRKDDFNQENTILQKIKDLQHPHIIRHLISIDKGDRAYIIFPWAEGGNLQSFWEGSEQGTSRESALWSMRQMKGLAEALHLLHERFQCRHGDLKPDNILCIREGGETVLKIADFGVSKIHHAQTINRKVATTSAFLTPSYQGPEVEFERVNRKDQRPRSRKYDIWSLGCVFLEFAIWLLHGPKAVENFAKARGSGTSPTGTSTPLYEVTDMARKVAKVHQLVSWTIRILQENPRCKGNTALAALLELINDQMLRTEVEERLSASEVFEKLGKIVRDAEEDESYLFHCCDGVGIPPLDFEEFHLRQRSSSH